MALTKEELVAVLDQKLGPIKDEISSLKSQLAEMKSFVDLANKKYDEISSKMDRFEAKRKKDTQENKLLRDTIKKLEEKVQLLELQSNDVRQYTRRDCLEIHGIPVEDGEDTNQLVKAVGDLMEVYLSDGDISTSHRLPSNKSYKGNRKTPATIVKFVRRDVKNRFYSARKELKGYTTKSVGFDVENRIFINESLTEQNKAIFNECFKLKKLHKFLFIWTSNGKTY